MICKLFLFCVLLLFSSSLYAAISPKDISKLSKKVEGSVVGVELMKDSGHILYLSSKELSLFDAESLEKLATHRFGINERALRLDVVDLVKGGASEVVVTSLDVKSLESYIFGIEMGEGYSFKVLASDLPYYFRVTTVDAVPVLVGQGTISTEAFAGAVYEMKLNGSKVRRGSRLDLPKKIGIYEFFNISDDGSSVWRRRVDGYLFRYKKVGRKWKKVYRSSVRYHPGANCFSRQVKDVMTERVDEMICIPAVPISLRKRLKTEDRRPKTEDLILLDSHTYFAGGVLLKPSLPRKAFIHILNYSDDSGVDECKQTGPYQGWIADYMIVSDDLIVVVDPSDFSSVGTKVDRVNLSNIDCGNEM